MKKILTIILLAATCVATQARNVFGIFIDSRTYAACSSEVDAYRDVLRQEGLDARIFSADWQTPE